MSIDNENKDNGIKESDNNGLKNKINKLIEETIEVKINKILEIIPLSTDINTTKYIYDYTVIELYNKTLQTVINIINDFSSLFSERKYLGTQEYRKKLFTILFQDERKMFVGIIFVILSFILYFIDGANA